MAETPPLLVVTVATPFGKPSPSLNTLIRHGGGWVKHRWLRRYEEEVQAALCGLSPAARRVFPLARARLRVTVYYCGTEPDEVNAIGGARKVGEDALVNMRILAGDTRAHLPEVETRLERVPHLTERRVVLEVWRLGEEEG